MKKPGKREVTRLKSSDFFRKQHVRYSKKEKNKW
jgi:hypothetical protein